MHATAPRVARPARTGNSAAAMRMSKLIAPDLVRVLEEDPSQLGEALQEVHPQDVADVLTELDRDIAVQVMRTLPATSAADVMERLPDDLQVHVIEAMDARHSAAVVTEMDADDRVDLVQDLPKTVRERVMEEVEQAEPGVAEDVRVLASYAEDTAGGLMTTEYLALWPELTVGEAIAELRTSSRERDLETVYYIYVVAYDRLVGVLSLRDLILGEPDQTLSSVMTDQVVSVPASMDQEEVAMQIAKYDLSAMPVVDDAGQMLGVVTVDDVVDVVMEEATEDAHMMAAVMPIEESYLNTSFLSLVRSRATWLVVLFVGELLTANVMHVYEAQLAAVLDLVIFIPLIISSGGNSGAQSSSLIIRALALGELSPGDWPRVMLREFSMGLTLGLMLGGVGFVRALYGGGLDDPMQMGMTVSAAIVAVVTLGTLVGSMMPLMIERLGGDPAVSSSPFVASLVDVLGLVLYFTIARVVFATVL